jgi:hypothetical protein
MEDEDGRDIVAFRGRNAVPNFGSESEGTGPHG